MMMMPTHISLLLSNLQEAPKDAKQEQPPKEEPKFQAFSGKKYSLRG